VTAPGALVVNATHTASAGVSKLADFQLAGTSKANIQKSGIVRCEGIGFEDLFNSGIYKFGSYGAALCYGSSPILGSDNACAVIGGAFYLSVYASMGTRDVALQRNAAGVAEINYGTAGTFRDLINRHHTMSGLFATNAGAPTIASAGTIAPTTQIAFVSGTTTISTITAPAPIASGGGTITLIPTGLWSTNTAGNIALATTAVVSRALTLTYDTTTGKWYPSY